MKIFFRKHIEGFLIGTAVILIGIIVSFFIWGIAYVSQNLNDVFASKSAGTQMVKFNLPAARNLNLKGLVQ